MRRRHFLARLLALLPALIAPPATGASAQPGLRKAMPRGGPLLPAIGLGTWLTFDVGDDYEAMRRRGEVLRRFLAHGGGMVDSSPMYGRAEWLLGRLLADLPGRERVFSATKIWTPLDAGGPRQLEDSSYFPHLP